jgi:thiamine pyrophosphokinase
METTTEGSGQYALLLIGGEGPRRQVLEPFLPLVRYILAADSGFDLALQLGLTPDLLVGDLDSVARSEALEAFPAEKIKKFAQEKDETDTEIGFRLLRGMGYTQIILAGGGGGRLDHFLGIVGMFERECPTHWFTRREHIQIVEKSLRFEGWKGQTVSLFPLGEGVQGLGSEGLKWSLNGLHWKRGDAGISNLVTHDLGKVSVNEGKLLMIRLLPEPLDG